ncbi:MAG: presqualene diphosphate synthase HpnD [Chloracidobacterium sp.]|nr:presqualene diphosphate synthase HpnD [Chloracidobacterium sp.]MDW8217797.1 presqualene diphosphate synthase HpnD [Acidobacteriota bacterium]
MTNFFGHITAPRPPVAEGITHSSRTNFLYSFLILPKPQRRAIETVYAFCRVVDDIVDGDTTGKTNPQAELDRWRDEIQACFNGHVPRHPLARELKAILQRFPIPQEHFLALIRGMEMDLARRRYASFAELDEYCYHVASVIGLMCIEIFGYRHAGARNYAIHLGKALQLINIVRDVKEDAARGRVYLPLDEMAAEGVTEGDLQDGRYGEAFARLAARQAQRARDFRAQALQALHPEDRPAMVAAEIMATIYFKLLDQMEATRFDVFRRRPRLSRLQKALVAASLLLRARLGRA